MSATRQHVLFSALVLIAVDVMVFGLLLYSVGDQAMHYAAYNGSPELAQTYTTPYTGGRMLIVVGLVLANLMALVTLTTLWVAGGKQRQAV